MGRLTESERLARWFGTWTGDPDDGWVMVTMTAEAEPGSPTRYDIDECTPPTRLAVSVDHGFGRWVLSAELSHHDGTTVLVFSQHDVDPGAVADIGPGWEWYLDRLGAALDGAVLPTLDDFESVYVPMGSHYAALLDP